MKDRLDKEKVIEFASYCIKNYDGINGLDSVFESFFAEKPLFTTNDGVDIFEGESIYGVTDNFLLLHNSFAQERDKTTKTFAKRENAEKYIRDNQKKYSLTDMVRIANHWAYIKSVNTEVALKVIESWKEI